MAVLQEVGQEIMQWSERLAQHSEPGWAEKGQLTVTYLTPAHLAVAAELKALMQEAGFDEISVDAVGNVVGLYRGDSAASATLLTGSHYDTVRNGGKYDGRLGILIPIAVVKALSKQKRRLPYSIEVVGFSEEEGQRFRATFLAAGALTGSFDPEWLTQRDADGMTMAEAMKAAGLPGTLAAIQTIKRDPQKYLGFVEVHIEQGPVLCEKELPLGVVTSINAGVRATCKTIGLAGHAGTTPMSMRQDAMLAAAEISLMAEQRARADEGSVATIGQIQVPGGSINVIPGECVFTLDMRAPTDPQRDALVSDIVKEAHVIANRRQVKFEYTEVMRASAAPSDPDWQSRWERAVAKIGQPVFKLNSGAGHDAMKMHTIMPQAMLFVRGGNRGISHNPLEIITAEDATLATQAFEALLDEIN
jgi:beta-ureidopropionase / N-carbamoyl-L-amino-acid hydrolase